MKGLKKLGGGSKENLVAGVFFGLFFIFYFLGIILCHVGGSIQFESYMLKQIPMSGYIISIFAQILGSL